MKRLPELARRGVALALAASMSLSILAPGALAASASVEHTPLPLWKTAWMNWAT